MYKPKIFVLFYVEDSRMWEDDDFHWHSAGDYSVTLCRGEKMEELINSSLLVYNPYTEEDLGEHGCVEFTLDEIGEKGMDHVRKVVEEYTDDEDDIVSIVEEIGFLYKNKSSGREGRL